MIKKEIKSIDYALYPIRILVSIYNIVERQEKEQKYIWNWPRVFEEYLAGRMSSVVLWLRYWK